MKQAIFAPFGFLRSVGAQSTKVSPHKKVQDVELVEGSSRQVPTTGKASQHCLQTTTNLIPTSTASACSRPTIHAVIPALGSRSLFHHIIIFYSPSVMAVFSPIFTITFLWSQIATSKRRVRFEWPVILFLQCRPLTFFVRSRHDAMYVRATAKSICAL